MSFEVKGEFTPGTELSKRFRMPGLLLVGKCPHCGYLNERDMGSACLYYPEANQPFKESFECRNEDCYKEIHLTLKINITLEVLDS